MKYFLLSGTAVLSNIVNDKKKKKKKGDISLSLGY